MDYQEIIELIGREAGGLPDDAAERAAETVLRSRRSTQDRAT